MIIQSQWTKNTKVKVSVKILELTSQMVSKYEKSPIHRKLTIRGLQRHQNCQISPSIFVVIALES